MPAELVDLAPARLELIELAWGPESLDVPRGEPHLGLAIIDAILSLRAHFESVGVPLINRYCDAAQGISRIQ
mgnify:CR=1